MTGYVLAPLFGDDSDMQVMRSAVAVGQRLHSHVQAIHVRFDPQVLAGTMAPGMSATMYDQMIEQANRDSRQRAAAARGVFDQVTAGKPRAQQPPRDAQLGFSTGWREVEGEDPVIIATEARLANFVVLGRPHDRADVHAGLAVEAVLFDAARPVIVVPAGTPPDWGRKIFVAWNGSAQCARAMFDALPFLKSAEEVTVGTIPDDVSPTAESAVTTLAWQGVAATLVTVDGEHGEIAPRLFAAAADRGCDAVVMGGYGHSRMREFILGGVTRHALHEAELPLIMSH